jgi:acyl-CoA reductase-like NAD-dependent aldehyde dehydrogenase
MSVSSMLIAGELVETRQVYEVSDPADGSIVGTAPECSPELVDQAMQAAEAAYRSRWSEDLSWRREVMERCACLLDSSAQEIGVLTTREQGMPLHEAIGMAVRAARTFRRYAALELPRSTIQDDRDAHVDYERRPVGVVAAIKPWNVPVAMAVNAIAPAFRAGCTIVLKPSPYTPLGTLLLGEMLREVVPPGALNVVSGGAEVGRRMVEHPVPRAVTFTGSTATGKVVNTLAARDLKRTQLELGGNDAAVVLDDVDPAAIADRLFWSAFRNCGQICMAVKRVYVPQSLHDAVTEALVARARSVRVGHGLDPGTELGPVNNLPQWERVVQMLRAAAAAGGRVRSGDQRLPAKGHFLAPTIVTEITEGTSLVDEEQFGPVLPVMAYDTVDEAIERANDTTYGLGASVWSSDVGRAESVADQLEAGTVWINTHGVIGPRQPFGGWKWSGLGTENGVFSVEAFTETRALHRPPRRGARSVR